MPVIVAAFTGIFEKNCEIIMMKISKIARCEYIV